MKTLSSDASETIEARVHAILDEYLAELRAGRAPDRGALLARHPELSESLAASFRALDFVYDAQGTLEPSEDSLGREETASAGRVLGDYRLVRELGRGGMAVVYEAEQISLARHVALKVLPFAAVLDPKQLQRFKNEAQAAAHLHHPHIVPVHAVGCERGVHYYAMQYVEGQSLAVAIHEMKDAGAASEGPKTPISSHGSNREPAYIRMAAALGVQAAEALDHAHQCGIVHRDVKPGNLLVDLAGTLWVTDFGLAHSMKDVGLTMTGELLGTIRYMSPEQALAKRVPIDHRTDVYSLGATLYELFTLEPAFPGDDPHLLIQNIASKEPVPPRQINPALPRDVETILLKAMSKDPTGRYATAQDLADDLQRFLDNLPIAATRPGLVRRAAKWSRRHRALVGVAAGVLLLAVAGLATGAALLWREQEQTKAAFDRAEGNLTLALKALDQIYLDEAAGNAQIREGLPRDLLERGLGFYQQFALENVQNQRLGLAVGNAHHRAGLIFRSLGQEDRARQAQDRAVLSYRAAIRLLPDFSEAHNNLGLALRESGNLAEAIREFREAFRLQPADYKAHYNLGRALFAQGDTTGAIREQQEAIRRKPDFAEAHHSLGIALHAAHDEVGAEREFREAIRLKPDFAEAHSNLGAQLRIKGDIDGAITEYRDAIRLNDKYPTAHYNLGIALRAKGRVDDAMQAFREAIRLKPDYSDAYSMLGNAMGDKHDRAGAIRAYREAIRLNSDNDVAHNNLGIALHEEGDLDGAIQEFREAIRLVPDRAITHFKLARSLAANGDLDGAIEEYVETIRLTPGDAQAHNNIGFALTLQGKFREALPWLRKARDLGSRPNPSRERLLQVERLAELEGSLDQVLSGQVRPRDTADRVIFAELLHVKSEFPAAVRMWTEAFTEDSALVEDLSEEHRYNAACSASRAADHGGPEASGWRGRALEWLRADLAAREKAPSELKAAIERWKKDPDLAGIRDRVGELPEPEQAAWRELWARVDATLPSARTKPR